MPAQIIFRLAVAWGLVSGHAEAAENQTPNANQVAAKAQSFDVRDLRLLEGPFKRAMELDKRLLLSLDTDRLLCIFRSNAGLPSSAEPLGGWEAPDRELRGATVGHYLTACSLMYAGTGDARL